MRDRLGTIAPALAALGLTVVLAGCGGEAPVDGSPVAATDGSATARPAATASAAAQQQPNAPAGSTGEQAPPSLPPGDPGLDAPAVPDPGTAPAEPHGHEEARRTVPAAAMLTTDTVEMMLGGSWQRHPGGADECVRPGAALGVRSMAYGGSDAGLVVQTVATYRDAETADVAIDRLERVARGCGWNNVRDPRLGSASVAADDEARSMVAVSAEGVVVMLVGTGQVTRGVGWTSLVDMALGSSCPAAPDGCH
jgi:hypothetical protein